MANTPNLQLPKIAANQDQKHVTHNDGLRLLDALVQLAVISRTLQTPPANPADGDRYIPASGANGAWAGLDLNVAAWQDGAWVKLVPRTGWQAYVVAEGRMLQWNGTSWGGEAFSGAAPSFPVIVAGVLTVTTSYAVPAPESGAADILDTINGGWDGADLILTGTAGVTLTIKDGTGNLKLGADRVLNNFEDSLVLKRRGTNWIELAYANNG